MRKASRLLAATVMTLALWGCGDEQPLELESDEVTQWLEEMTSDDAGVRRQAVESLGNAWPQGARAVPVLSEALDDEDPGVRSAAASSLETLARSGWPFLHEFLRDEDDSQRQGLLEATGSIRKLGAKVSPRDGVEYVAHEPRGGLVFMGLGMGRITRDRPRNRANRPFLGFLGRCADPSFQDGLGIEDPRWPGTAAAMAAVAGMVALGPDEKRSVPESLRRLTEDDDENMAALGKLALSTWEARPMDPDAFSGEREPGLDFEALAVEIQRHQRPSALERPSTNAWDVVERLRDLAPRLTAPQQDRLVALLVEGWDSELGRKSRSVFVEVLGDIGPRAAAAVPLVAKELETSEETWRRYLAQGEGEAAPGDLVALYEELGVGFDRALGLRLVAADALGGIGPSAKDAAPLLRHLVTEAEPTLRYVAARSLRRIGAPQED